MSQCRGAHASAHVARIGLAGESATSGGVKAWPVVSKSERALATSIFNAGSASRDHTPLIVPMSLYSWRAALSSPHVSLVWLLVWLPLHHPGRQNVGAPNSPYRAIPGQEAQRNIRAGCCAVKETWASHRQILIDRLVMYCSGPGFFRCAILISNPSGRGRGGLHHVRHGSVAGG